MKSLKKVLPALLALLVFNLLLFPGNQVLLEHFPNNQISENVQKLSAGTVQNKIYFEPNYGQCKESVEFVTRGKGYSLFLESTEIQLLLQNNLTSKLNHIRLGLTGANQETQTRGFEEQSGKSNYFIGNNPEHWLTDIPNYSKVIYEEVYSGIDLVYYGNEGELEYDFIVSPGGNPEDIKLKYDYDELVRVDKDGNLILRSDHPKLIMRAPIAYQGKGENKKLIEAEFKLLADKSIVFNVGKYDAKLPLVIDPVIVYSTYLGGSESDYASSITVDDEGCVYVAGKTTSLDFPTENAYQEELHPAMFSSISDAFVTKFSASGNELIYSTYIGGRWDDEANSIAVDGQGRACITGRTSSNDDENTPEYEGFPLMNAYQTDVEPNFSKVFVTVLNASGNSLEYSTYLGGKMEDWAEDIALDPSGNIYIVGTTFSASFPTKNAFMPNSPSGYFDAFVAKFDPYLSGEESLIYSTYLGGDLDDWGKAIAVDQQGCAYVTGQCKSTDWPVTGNAIQSSRVDVYEAYITKLSASGTTLEYSTYLGSQGTDEGRDIAVDSEGHAYVCGNSNDGFYTTPGAFKTTVDFGSGFFSKLMTDGSGFEFSTHIPMYNFILDSEGTAYFVATKRQAGTSMDTFIGDVYLLALKSDGSDTLYTHTFGGSESDWGNDIAVDNEGNLYVLGSTNSADFPTMNAYQPIHNGGGETFITKLMPGDPEANLTVNPDPIYFTMIPAGQVSREPVDIVNASNRAIEISNIDVEPLSLFTLEELPDFPVTLDPGEKLELQIAFSPGGSKSTKEAQSSGGMLTIVSDAENPITTVPIILSGIIINLSGDESDANPSDGICDIDPNEDGFQVTLRAAIEHINAMGFDEVTSVTFDIPGDEVPVIESRNIDELVVNYPIHLDASTQKTGYVVLDGSKADRYDNGLVIKGGNSTIKSMNVVSFGMGGIKLTGKGKNRIQNCVISGNGQADLLDDDEDYYHRYGIGIDRSGENVVDSCIISDNNEYGIWVFGKESNFNVFSDNKIGTDITGKIAKPNSYGIKIIAGASGNVIVENTISGNKLVGVAIDPRGEGFKSITDNVISGNCIGVGSDKYTPLANSVGILLEGYKVEKTIIDHNIVAGNKYDGILVWSNTHHNTIQFNRIGVDTAGRKAIPNGGNGINLGNCSDNLVQSNIIGCNLKNGIMMVGDKDKDGNVKLPAKNIILKNFIGVKSSEYDPANEIGNTQCGIYVDAGIPEIKENYIFSNQIGIQLLRSNEGVIRQNHIEYNSIGMELEDSKSKITVNRITNNFQGIVVNGRETDIAANLIFGNTGPNTGIHIVGAAADIRGNFLYSDSGNAITVEGDSKVSVNYNNFMENVGYGLENLESSIIVNAQDNFWGDDTGPGGVGPGTGDMVSNYIDYTNWFTDPISVYAAAESDTIFAPIGETDSLVITLASINYYWDVLDVTLNDELGWLDNAGSFEVIVADAYNELDQIYFTIPNNVADGTANQVQLSVTSQNDTSDSFTTSFKIIATDAYRVGFFVSPDTVEITQGESYLFSAVGYDQFYRFSTISPDWSCTGGSINDTGLYTAGNQTGTFEVIAEDPLSGATQQAQIIILRKVIVSGNKPIEEPIAKSYIKKIYPNPFNSSTTINYYLDEPAIISIKIYNLMGQEVELLERAYLPIGEYETVWQPKDLPGGIYFCRFQLSNRLSEKSFTYIETRKLLLMR